MKTLTLRCFIVLCTRKKPNTFGFPGFVPGLSPPPRRIITRRMRLTMLLNCKICQEKIPCQNRLWRKAELFSTTSAQKPSPGCKKPNQSMMNWKPAIALMWILKAWKICKKKSWPESWLTRQKTEQPLPDTTDSLCLKHFSHRQNRRFF